MVSPLAMGLWPIAGVTSLGVEDRQSIATIQTAIECGINHFDTAYSYGTNGRSDRILKTACEGNFENIVIASKVGMHFDSAGVRQLDSRPVTLKKQCDEILTRLEIDRIDLLYLHCVDAETPIEHSAQAMADLIHAGKVRYVGVSNVDAAQIQRFASVQMPVAVQLPLNLLQPETYQAVMPTLAQYNISYVAFWAMMKGMLAGKMRRDHKFDPLDKRTTYEIYQGAAWQQAHDLIDRLRIIAAELNWSVARLVVAWTMSQKRVASVLVGAKNVIQIVETAKALQQAIADDTLQQIELALAATGLPSTTSAP